MLTCGGRPRKGSATSGWKPLVLRSDFGRRVVRHVYPAVEIPIHFVESEFYLLRTSGGTRLVPGLARPCAAQAAAGFRCWDLKLKKGTVLEPRGAGVSDARGRRAASPRVGGWEKRNTMIIWCMCLEANPASFQFRCFFPLASVSAGRLLVSARKPRSGVLAQGVC